MKEFIMHLFSFEYFLWLSAVCFWMQLSFLVFGLLWTPVKNFFSWIDHFYWALAWAWYPIEKIKERHPVMLKNVQECSSSEDIMRSFKYKFVVWVCERRLK